MTVTAYPVILIDSNTGSDSLASGAGPSTAIHGTAASTNGGGTVVTLDSGTVLTGVATDGSHVIYFADSTAGDRNFAAINATSGSGGGTPTVTVEQALTGSLSGKSWAIGGKRASVGSASSSKLFLTGVSSAGDLCPGWTVELQSGHSETISAGMNFYPAGDVTIGPITVRGAAGASTLPKLIWSSDDTSWVGRGDLQVHQDYEMQNSNATKSASTAFSFAVGSNSIGPRLVRMKIADATNNYYRGINCITGNNNTVMLVRNCEVAHCSDFGIGVSTNPGTGQLYKIFGNYIHDNGASTSHGGIYLSETYYFSCVIANNIIVNNTGPGIYYFNDRPSDGGMFIIGNTIDGNSGDGFVKADSNLNTSSFAFVNNIITNNGGYGTHFSDASATDCFISSQPNLIIGNNTYGNTSGAYKSATGTYTNSNCPWASGDPGVNPTYTGSGNYTPTNSALIDAFPLTIP